MLLLYNPNKSKCFGAIRMSGIMHHALLTYFQYLKLNAEIFASQSWSGLFMVCLAFWLIVINLGCGSALWSDIKRWWLLFDWLQESNDCLLTTFTEQIAASLVGYEEAGGCFFFSPTNQSNFIFIVHFI